MGIDYGTKRIGIALSDEGGMMAFPDRVILNIGIGASAKEILSMCKEKKVGMVVLGESRNFKGEENIVMGDIKKIKEILEKEILVVYQNEMFSSAEAARPYRTHKGIRERGENKMLDASAAAIILESYLASSC